MERALDRRFGSTDRPLLVSGRSGSHEPLSWRNSSRRRRQGYLAYAPRIGRTSMDKAKVVQVVCMQLIARYRDANRPRPCRGNLNRNGMVVEPVYNQLELIAFRDILYLEVERDIYIIRANKVTNFFRP